MSDIISFADWQTLQTLIQQGNVAVSGMTAAEAQATLGATANSGLYTYQAITAAGANNVINFPNAATAAEAAAGYVAAGGTTSVTGAATAASGAAETTANLTVIEGGAAGTSGVAGLLTMPLPTVAAALAPLAGVSLGFLLYEASPDFWEKLSKLLLPFCYDDSELIPVATDENGNTYFNKALIDAYINFFSYYDGKVSVTTDKIGIIEKIGNIYPFKFNGHTTIIMNSNNYGIQLIPQEGYEGRDAVYAFYDMGIIVASKVRVRYDITGGQGSPYSGDLGSRITLDYYSNTPGYEFYYDYWQASTRYMPDHSLSDRQVPFEPIDSENARRTALFMLYGDVIDKSLPNSIGKWNGNSYPESVTPLNVLTGYDKDGKPIFIPYYPVTIPIGDPGVSTDPAVNPDPTVNPNPAPAIEPFISPVPNPNNYPESVPVPEPAPLPNPVPLPQPVPSPEVDPSVIPEKTPSNPEPPKKPIDGGDSGSPIVPVIPTLPSSATGLLHVYNPTQSQIDAFGSWLWTTFSGDLIDTLSKLFNDPMDAVIGLHELYATPSTQGDTTIKAGFLDSGVSSKLVGNRYTTINCGSVVVEEYYQNYLDYSPYTQVYIYLPFIGIVSVSADDIIGNAVNITYHIDSYTGCCIAVISVARQGYSSTVYQFEGNCAVEIPITSGYQSSLMAGLIGVAGTAISGSPSVGLTATHIGRAGLGKNTVSHSGSFGSSYGAMGCKIPYIIVRRPIQKKISDYSKSYGYPAHKMVYVGNCNGYLRAKEVIVTSTTATNLEKEMIVSALKSGVYVK